MLESSRSSHERRRPTGPAAFTGELGLPGRSLETARIRDNTRYHPSFFFFPPSAPSSTWATLGAAHGTLRAASLESTRGQRCSSLAIRSPSRHAHPQRAPRHRRASLHPIASPAGRLGTGRHPYQPHARSEGFGTNRRRGIGERRAHAVLFSGVSAVPTPQDSGPPLHACLTTDVRSPER